MSMKILEVTVLPDGRMDRKNAATYCGLSVKTLAMYATNGIGPKSTKRGKVWYWKDDLDAWLTSGKTKGHAPISK